MTKSSKPNKTRKRFNELTETIEHAKSELISLQFNCEHENMHDNYGNGYCEDCGYETSGWFCKTSPIKECVYKENEECIHCGDPDERK